MTDFRTWIVGQSAKLGYDFNALTREDQENIISSLLSYAEDAFRSQCDYPDMRFGKRRGIYRANANKELPPDSKHEKTTETQNYLLSSNSENCIDDGCTNNSAISCGDTNHCIDTNCTNTAGCTNDTCEDMACYNRSHDCHDEKCTDENTCRNQTTCVDSKDCVDQCCINDGICKDETEDPEDPENIDYNCTNKSFCNDEGKCKDDTCYNSGEECRDINNQSGKCMDYICINEDNCKDEPAGTDQICKNEANCSDSAGSSTHCIDNLCQNYSICMESGAESNKCEDNACINSSSKYPWETCHDTNCSDTSCFNVASMAEKGSCQDAPLCMDMGCFNYLKETCTNICGDAIDQYCINYPITGTNACGNTAIDTGRGCYDYGNNQCKSTKEQNTSDSTTFPCTDHLNHCTDTGSSTNFCIDGIACFNEGNCIDEKYCSDNQCTNELTCRDETNCSDTNCKNNGLCQDVVGECNDNTCINKNCIDIGINCSDDAQLCTNENCPPFQMP